MKPLAEPDDAFAWSVIAQVAELLATEADRHGGGVRAAFEVVEDALAERRQAMAEPGAAP